MENIIWRCVVFFAVFSYATNLAELDARATAACTSTSIKNGGFETGGLANWQFEATYPQLGTATCAVVNVGDGRSHSAEMDTSSTPGDTGNAGTLQQVFTGCVNVTYNVTWSLFQVKGKTTYDPRYNYNPSMAVYLYGPNGFTYGLASYSITRTNFTTTDRFPSKTYQAGVWNSQSGWLKFPQTGNWTLNFRTYAFSYTSGASTTNAMGIDKVVVKPVA